MTMKLVVSFLICLGSASLTACGGEGALGDACGESGAEGECEDGAVCAKESDASDELVCLKVCTDQDDCDGDEECNGVDGTNVKGCRLK